MRASSSLRKQTMLVGVPLSAYFYVAQADERMLAVAIVNKVCWFESHYRHILCSLRRWTRASSSFRKQTMWVQVPLSAYFYGFLLDWVYVLIIQFWFRFLHPCSVNQYV